MLTGGIMHALVTHGKEFVLVGSVRDDGPLPDVYTDVIDGQRAMRAELADVGFCLMVATMLHSVATGNILPASIPLVCVDINPATVTKLADRGSSQARGIVTDVGLFLEQLALELVPELPARLNLRSARRARSAAPTTPASGPSAAPDQRRTARCADAAPASARAALAGGPEQQVAGGRDAAADDDDVRVEGGHQVGHADPQPVADRRRTPPARRVAGLGGRGDHRSGEPVGSPPQAPRAPLGSRRAAPGVADQGVAAGSTAPSSPRPPHSHGRPSGHHLHVPELPRHPVAPAVQLAVEQHARRRCRCRA